jgi:hypothetical protein
MARSSTMSSLEDILRAERYFDLSEDERRSYLMNVRPAFQKQSNKM